VDYGFLSCGAVWSCRWLRTFRRNPEDGGNTLSESLVTTDKITRRKIPDHNSSFHRLEELRYHIYIYIYTEWFKVLVRYLRRLLGRSFAAESANDVFLDSPPLPSDDVWSYMWFMVLCICWLFTVILCTYIFNNLKPKKRQREEKVGGVVSNTTFNRGGNRRSPGSARSSFW
jgi:hypothetical protein